MSDFVEEVQNVEIRLEQLEELHAKVESQKKKLKKQKKKLELFEKQKEEIENLKDDLKNTLSYAKEQREDVMSAERFIGELQGSNQFLSTRLEESLAKIAFLEQQLQEKTENDTEVNQEQEETEEAADSQMENEEKERISYNRDEFLALRDSEETKDSFEKLKHDDVVQTFKKEVNQLVQKQIETKENRISDIDDMLQKISDAKAMLKKIEETQEKEKQNPSKDPLVIFGCIYIVLIVLYFIFF